MTALAIPLPLACPRSRFLDPDRRMTTNPTFDLHHEQIEYKLDSLLAAWFTWRQSFKLTRGYSGQDATCRDYRSPGHWDWKNGAADARAEELQVEAVDVAVDKIPNSPQRWNTALQFEARNLVSGAAVWSSPMLPQEFEEREVLVREARNMLLKELRRVGVMT
jgi:hypothetical protein